MQQYDDVCVVCVFYFEWYVVSKVVLWQCVKLFVCVVLVVDFVIYKMLVDEGKQQWIVVVYFGWI